MTPNAAAVEGVERYTPVLRINADGSQWWLERPHYTGTDIGPAHYSKKPLPVDEIAAQIAYYSRAGYRIDDQRRGTP